MHKLATTSGEWDRGGESVTFVRQNPAPIIFLSSADTELQTLAASLSFLVSDFPEIRAANLLALQQQLSIDTYVETVLSQARIIILRLLGGRAYWSYGLEIVKETAKISNTALFVLPGDDFPDPDLISHSSISLKSVDQLWHYLVEGGIENYVNGLKFVADVCLNTNYNPPLPKPVSDFGEYRQISAKNNFKEIQLQKHKNIQIKGTKVGILFYRSHYLAGNTLPIDVLCESLLFKGIEPIPLYLSSLRKTEIQQKLLTYCQQNSLALLINTTSFSVVQIDDTATTQIWQELNLPVLQIILSSSSKQQWKSSRLGLMPRDIAMNVALPEVDGRIITRAISFKSVKTWHERLETEVIIYQPEIDRVNFVTDLVANWLCLQQTAPSERKIALILANYPNKDGRLANGVGLDTPASCIIILQALKSAGYQISHIPQTGDELIQLLTTGITNDPESRDIRSTWQSLSVKEYWDYFFTLPEKVKQGIISRWGNWGQGGRGAGREIPIPGIQLDNVFIGIQPSRGYDRDPSLNYHAPDLEPTHEYLAYYYWLRAKFGVQAIVHVGKHGNLEWLPGKSVALSKDCYPEVALQAIPNIYPFIVNDPGEGTQAKRRSGAVIIDHLTPPLTRAELYGGLAKLETLIDEYYEAQALDPSRLNLISSRITRLIATENLERDLGINNLDSVTEFLAVADGYLCELKEAQIRDGLHIFGKCPQNKQLRDLIVAIARCPSLNRLGITQALAQDLGLDFNPLIVTTEKIEDSIESLLACGQAFSLDIKQINHQSDAIELLETIIAQLVDRLINNIALPITESEFPHTYQQLQWIQTQLLPNLQQTKSEITNLLKGLNGEYINGGASGAPTRGKPEVLPTGRNFYSVDLRAIPTPTAWDIGRKAAETVIERYTQENGEYPQTLAISIWGTSTMRTGGDDIAQVMALMGVQPVWDDASRRVIDFEIIPSKILNRPRVDVTVRVSGFFRDSFPIVLNLLNNITRAISDLQEEKEINPLASRVREESEFWQQQGLSPEQARDRASYRVFGSKPGAYGAGLQGLIEAQNWQDDRDLARAYLNWSSYAYDDTGKGHWTPEAFERRLTQLQIVLHNQDNREHDLLDSDDYYQFQGGLTVAVRSLTGQNPKVYFGDNSVTANPRVRKLTEEIARVYRSRVVNPKWIAGVMRHGYKGAFEMAATVDYLFAYDATTKCVEDHMYLGVAKAYILDANVQQFVREKNPWALRDMAERLLEANQRGMWQNVSSEILEELRSIVHEAEGVIEEIK
jgi:cobaltochelatase CobN